MSASKYNGILLVNKPSGMTSHDVVDELRHILGQRAVGHTGTLDPAAEGLLLLCVGRATKISRYLTSHDKSYEAVIVLGLTSRTYDSEGIEPDDIPNEIPDLEPDSIKNVLARFTGLIQQRVSAHSAVKVDGKPLYKTARAGKNVEPPVREVRIDELSLEGYEKPNLRVNIKCGAGTYIRSLAHDIGQTIGCGAYLGSLKRTEIGRFSVWQAQTINELRELALSEQIPSVLLPMEKGLDLAAICVSDAFAPRVSSGVRPGCKDVLAIDGMFAAGDSVALMNSDGRLLAVGRAEVDSNHFRTSNEEKLFSFERVLS